MKMLRCWISRCNETIRFRVPFYARKGVCVVEPVSTSDFGRRGIHIGPVSRKSNVILTGSPGSGKTTVGRILAANLRKSIVDVDNDHLEPYWGMSVADKLQEVGEEGFIEAEGNALLNLHPENSVVSLSGSNPMHKPAMEHIKKTGVTVFLDVQHSDIIQRLEKMKVDRIVGQKPGVDFLDILEYRQQFYEDSYDIRIIVEPNEPPLSVARKCLNAVKRYNKPAGFVSTRGSDASQKTFCDVVLDGLASDGGLYVSNEKGFKLTIPQWSRLVNLSYPERALRILEKWIDSQHLAPAKLRSMCHLAYNVRNFNCMKTIPVVHLQNNQYVCELFHGPTASFKDAALQLMPQFFHHAALEKEQAEGRKQKYLIVVATSGDTGGAVLDGFGRLPKNSGIDVIVFYPEDGISDIQKLQMTSADAPNVKVIGVKSDFDFCQSVIKQIFNDETLNSELKNKYEVSLSAANSINWGRLLPQIVYHASSYLELAQKGVIRVGDPVDLCIPTGNFGNILAAYYAKNMGIPFRRLVCASNENNVLAEFFSTGVYNLTTRKLYTTSSPAIDILKSSNLERFLYHASGDTGDLVKQLYTELREHKYFTVPKQIMDQSAELFLADWCNEKQSLRTISRVFKETGYLLDPHTAVGKTVADRFNDPHCPMLIAATAHYAKFAPEVLKGVGHLVTAKSPSVLEWMNTLEELEPWPKLHTDLVSSVLRSRIHRTVCDAKYSDVVNQLKQFVVQRHKQ